MSTLLRHTDGTLLRDRLDKRVLRYSAFNPTKLTLGFTSIATGAFDDSGVADQFVASTVQAYPRGFATDYGASNGSGIRYFWVGNNNFSHVLNSDPMELSAAIARQSYEPNIYRLTSIGGSSTVTQGIKDAIIYRVKFDSLSNSYMKWTPTSGSADSWMVNPATVDVFFGGTSEEVPTGYFEANQSGGSVSTNFTDKFNSVINSIQSQSVGTVIASLDIQMRSEISIADFVTPDGYYTSPVTYNGIAYSWEISGGTIFASCDPQIGTWSIVTM